MAVDPRDFLLNTDYEMDKIILFKEGSLNSGQYDVSLPHSLGFAPLIFGVCAFNADFSDPRSIPYTNQTSTDFVTFDVSATSTDIKVSYNSSSGTPSKAYYRIYAFEPSDVTASIPSTSGDATNFILNTDYNYCKLYQKGVINASNVTTITHNFGYLPQVMAWRESNGKIFASNIADWYSGDIGDTYGVKVTPTEVVLKFANIGLDRVHYRIYYDEA